MGGTHIQYDKHREISNGKTNDLNLIGGELKLDKQKDKDKKRNGELKIESNNKLKRILSQYFSNLAICEF